MNIKLLWSQRLLKIKVHDSHKQEFHLANAPHYRTTQCFSSTLLPNRRYVWSQCLYFYPQLSCRCQLQSGDIKKIHGCQTQIILFSLWMYCSLYLLCYLTGLLLKELRQTEETLCRRYLLSKVCFSNTRLLTESDYSATCNHYKGIIK